MLISHLSALNPPCLLLLKGEILYSSESFSSKLNHTGNKNTEFGMFIESVTLKMVVYPLIGGILGFGYYKFIGCKSGTCPITRNPFISILYGAMLGLLAAA